MRLVNRVRVGFVVLVFALGLGIAAALAGAVTEQQVEELIDLIIADREGLHIDAKIEEYGAEMYPILKEMFFKYATDDRRVGVVSGLMSRYLDASAVGAIMAAYAKNVDLEDEVVPLLAKMSRMGIEEAFIELDKIAFNPQKEPGPEDTMPPGVFYRRIYADVMTPERVKYLLPRLREISFLDENRGGLSELLLIAIKMGKPPEVIPVVAERLKHKDPVERNCAVAALGEIGDRLAVPYIKEAKAREADLGNRLLMSEVLVKLGEFLELEFIIQMLADRDRDIREEALESLRVTTGQDFGEDVEVWRNWFEAEKKARGL